MWRGGGRGTQGEWGPAVCHGQCWAGGEGSPTAAPYWHFVSWGSVPPPALQAEHQAGTQPAVPGGAVPTGCEIHSISSDLNRDSTQQDPHWECPFSSGPSPFHLPLSLGVPGAFHLSLFSPGSVYGCFCTGSVFFFLGDVGTQSTVVGMCASSAQQVKLRTSQAPTVGLEEVDFLPQSACLCVSVLSCSVCCPPCRLSARFSRTHHLC